MGKKISIDDTADELGISRRGVRRLISSGELKAYRVGVASIRVDVDDIAAVLKPVAPQTFADTPEELAAPLKPPTPLPKRPTRPRSKTSRG